jgi:hypothetical protein
MSRTRKAAAAAALAAFLAAPAIARADEPARMQSLEDRLRVLEDRLGESQRLIASQDALLRNQAVTPDAAAPARAERVDGFLQSLEIGGHVSGSYVWSFNAPDVNAFTNTLCQFNCNHDEFSFDAAKLELGRPARGSTGFRLDLLLGQNAAILRSLAPTADSPTPFSRASDTDLFVQQAFVAYDAGGTLLKLGKFETLLGYELLDSNANANVTHGILFTYAIPLFHTGILASGSFGESFSWAAGAVNGFNNSREQGDNKGLLGQLAWTSGPVFLSASSYVGTLGETRTRVSNGAVVGDDDAITQIWDVIARSAPSDGLTLWVNADWGTTERGRDVPGGITSVGQDPTFFGVATGATFELTPALDLSLRAEYMNDDEGSRFGGLVPDAAGLALDEIDAYALTLTLGWQLAPSVRTRLELRRDLVDCDSLDCEFFFAGSGAERSEDTNDLGIVEVVYSFD